VKRKITINALYAAAALLFILTRHPYGAVVLALVHFD
jgi:hypothetical protein